MGIKVKFYIISLWFLFLFLCIGKIELPFKNDQFIGWSDALGTNVFACFCILMMFLGIIFYGTLNYAIVKGAKIQPQKIGTIENINFETLSFLATYIIPLVTFTIDGLRSIIILLLMIILMGIIFVKTNAFYTNPSLAVLNYRVYRVTTDQLHDAIVIVRGKLKKDDFIRTKKISDNIHIAEIYKK